jgi:phosphoribosylformimino-5-aminoimidazole carboxamide ribotide isomerase
VARVLVIPAIDLRDGQCVRLLQGDYAQSTVFSDDPAAIAARWSAAGSSLLHVVDLDGAKAGRIVNRDAIRAICAAFSMPVELGGGVRSLDDVVAALELGASRVILGTAAVEDRAFVRSAVERFGERIVVGIDARDGLVATRGWTITSAVRSLDLAREMVALGVQRIIYTDIHRDGTLTEPGYDSTADLVRHSGARVIASGGVSQIKHLRRLAELGCEGAIVGRALYTGDLDLGAALASVDGQRVQLLHPESGKNAPRIAASHYEAVRMALLGVIAADASGDVLAEVTPRVAEALDPTARQELGSVGWYSTWVRLDLEARGLIERIPGSRPLRVRRRD